jgi:hypothetical protein
MPDEVASTASATMICQFAKKTHAACRMHGAALTAQHTLLLGGDTMAFALFATVPALQGKAWLSGRARFQSVHVACDCN